MEKKRVYVGIVSYNPDLIRLKENIDSILPQADEVVIFENGSSEQNRVISCLDKRVRVLISEKNIGIAAALNRLMEYGYGKHYSWMLSLDQDSLCDTNFVKDMLLFLTVEKNIGIAAPVIKDRNIGVVGHDPPKSYIRVNTCITSGAFVNMNVWKSVGGYDESMFIDSVDFEFCYRVRKYGYSIIQIRDVILIHELGNSVKRKFFCWNINVNGHSAFRKFYIARNNVYYPLKHRLWFHFIRGNFRNVKLILIVLIYEKDKKDKIRSITNGWREGVLYHLNISQKNQELIR